MPLSQVIMILHNLIGNANIDAMMTRDVLTVHPMSESREKLEKMFSLLEKLGKKSESVK